MNIKLKKEEKNDRKPFHLAIRWRLNIVKRVGMRDLV